MLKIISNSIEHFANHVTPIWASQIESSRKQMEDAIYQLTNRFANINANIDTTLDPRWMCWEKMMQAFLKPAANS